MKILVSTSSFGKYDTEPLNLLRTGGYETVLNPYGRTLKPVEVIELATGCSGIIAGTEVLDRQTLTNLPGLKVISRVGSGTDNVDMQAAAALGITVTNTPNGPVQAVAELTVGLALALFRGIPSADALIRRGVWQKNMGWLLSGKNVGVIGLGKIGRAVALLFTAFGCRVSGCDIFPDEAWAAANSIELTDLDNLLTNSDLITIHAVSGRGAAALIGAREIERLKVGACLINTARGNLIEEDALIEALKSRRIAGAALDVFADEPYAGRLSEFSNVVLTPHIGSYAIESRVKMEVDAVQNLLAVIAG